MIGRSHTRKESGLRSVFGCAVNVFRTRGVRPVPEDQWSNRSHEIVRNYSKWHARCGVDNTGAASQRFTAEATKVITKLAMVKAKRRQDAWCHAQAVMDDINCETRVWLGLGCEQCVLAPPLVKALGVMTADIVVLADGVAACSHMRSSNSDLSLGVLGAALLGLRVASPIYLQALVHRLAVRGGSGSNGTRLPPSVKFQPMRHPTGKRTMFYVAEQFVARHPSLVRLLQHAASPGMARDSMSTWILYFDAASFKSQQAFYEGDCKAPAFVGLQVAEDLHKFVRAHCRMMAARSTHGKFAASRLTMPK